MKKILSVALCALMLVSMLALVGCGNDKKDDKTDKPADDNASAAVKFGAGVYLSNIAATDATEDQAGQGSVDVTVAAVTVDADGKIVACDLDTMQNAVTYTFEGKAVAKNEFKTKREFYPSMGENVKAWHEQADAFETVIVGKTIAQVKALVLEDNKGSKEVADAGCTIKINEFVGAIEKAVANAKTEVAADASLKVAIATVQTCTDATEDQAGSNKVTVNICAAAQKDGKFVAASSDCVEVSFGFDVAGKSSFDATKAVQTKREFYPSMGENTKTWSEQADAFDAACVGKTGAEIAGLQAEDSTYGVDSLKSAGCTIKVDGFVAAASKI